MLGDFALMLREIIPYFQENFRRRSIQLMRSFHEPIIAWKVSIVAFKGICHYAILVFGRFYEY